jgi:hypothetical protein
MALPKVQKVSKPLWLPLHKRQRMKRVLSPAKRSHSATPPLPDSLTPTASAPATTRDLYLKIASIITKMRLSSTQKHKLLGLLSSLQR